MAQNHILLETIQLSQFATSVTFDNIPQTGYTDLKLLISAFGNTTEGMFIYFNGSTSNFAGVYVYTDGTTASTGSLARYIGSITANTFTPNSAEVYISNYTSSASKPFHSHEAAESNSSTGFVNLTQGVWSQSAAITSVTIDVPAGIRAGSIFSLFGVAALGTTPVTAPFASGGNIVANDGTYWYHAFLSSGTFTPLKALSCDVVVVGGGGGGAADASGGGGAGGLLAFASQSLTAQNYSAVIGAGGAGGPLNTSGTVGVDSQFGALTLVKGGGAGTRSGIGGTGGSGGGGSGRGKVSGDNPAGGSPTSGQGNAGGAGAGSSTGGNQSGGGGGGAGGAGAAAGQAVGGNGGIGINTYSTWHTATNTGVSGYIAAGGGGAPYTAGTYGTGGSGGGGSAGANGSAGIASTGSGGGSSANGGTGGAGGSGIILIRYAMV